MPKTAEAPSPARPGGIAKLCGNISLSLAACLVFLVPFNAMRNIDLQGSLLIVSGVFAWVSLLAGTWKLVGPVGRLESWLAGIFLAAAFASLLVNPHIGYDFFGAPYVRLGLGAFIAYAGIGLLARTVPSRQLIAGFYGLILGLALAAIPYSWFNLHSLLRVGGTFAQADILACFLGCGLLFGLELWLLYPARRRALIASQGFLALVLLLTQTRSVLALVVVLSLVWISLHYPRKVLVRSVLAYVLVITLALFVLHRVEPSRLTSASDIPGSIHYRLVLQRYALDTSWNRPVLGYGPGNLADPLACPKLPAGQLQTTCQEGYFFNSSHNLFLDRVLAVGWPAGLAFLGLVVLALYRGLRRVYEYRIFGYALLLVSGYYLTNVTHVTLELLFWVLLSVCLAARIRPTSRA